MTKARDLADFVSAGNPLADGTLQVADISDLTATATELNTLDGITATTSELNGVAGINTNVQTQLDLKAPLASPTLTGTVTIGGTTYPTSDGTEGQVLTTNGSGAVSFADPSGGGSADFVASGAIANGDVVILNSDGTVSVVTATSDQVGSTTTFESSGNPEHMSATFDSANNKVVIGYRDQNNSGYPTVVVGTVSGTSISFGTPVVVSSVNSYYVSVVFAGGSHNKIVVSFRDIVNFDYGRAAVGQVSGNSITFGSVTTFNTAQSNWMVSTFDTLNSKVVIVFNNQAVIGTINGTFNSISFGTPVTFDSVDVYSKAVVFDNNANKVVIVYYNGTDGNFSSVVGTVSGTSISFGSVTIIDTDAGDFVAAAFDTNSNKVVAVYRSGTGDAGASEGQAYVGTVSGTSISFGSKVIFESNYINYPSATFDSSVNKVVIAYRDNQTSNRGEIITGSVSGTTMTFGTPVVFETSTTVWPVLTYDSNATKTVVGWSSANDGDAAVFSHASTDAGGYLGIATAAIADTATGSITINGGINESQSSLAVGTTYYVADNGTLQTTNNGRKIGKAISATKLLVNSNMSGDEMNAYLGGLV